MSDLCLSFTFCNNFVDDSDDKSANDLSDGQMTHQIRWIYRAKSRFSGIFFISVFYNSLLGALWLLICSKNTFYLFALKKVFYVLKKVFCIQKKCFMFLKMSFVFKKSVLCSQKSLLYSKNVFYVIK